MAIAGLKRLLRPLVHSSRDALERARALLRRPSEWDGTHHPALLRFEPWAGEADGRCFHDFLGVKTDASFRPQFRADPPGPIQTQYPTPTAEYLELTFVLGSVLDAAGSDPFTVVELGAGYGPWLVTAHRAMQLRSNAPVRLVGVEMVRQHHDWMLDHLRTNGIDPGAHRLIHGAVSDFDGTVLYRAETDLRFDFGQSVTSRSPGAAPPPDADRRAAAVEVPCVSFGSLLAGLDRVDLLHVDLQGEELRVLGSVPGALNEKVRRVLAATHSSRIHRRMRRQFVNDGWQPVYDFGLRAVRRTPFGDVRFLDGMLAFVNPRL